MEGPVRKRGEALDAAVDTYHGFRRVDRFSDFGLGLDRDEPVGHLSGRP